jgi:hypothetical protein
MERRRLTLGPYKIPDDDTLCFEELDGVLTREGWRILLGRSRLRSGQRHLRGDERGTQPQPDGGHFAPDCNPDAIGSAETLPRVELWYKGGTEFSTAGFPRVSTPCEVTP